MKTDLSHACWIAMTSFFILAAVIKPSEEKCSGRWAIHACWGGNGKRSDPSIASVGPSSNILRRLLLRNQPLFASPAQGDSSQDLVAPSEDQGDSSSFGSDVENEYNVPPPSSPSLSRLSALLRTLRTLQRENDALP